MRSMLAAALVLLCAGLLHAQDKDGDRKLDLSAEFSGFNTDNLTSTNLGPESSNIAKGFDLGAAWYPEEKIAVAGNFGYHRISDAKSSFSIITLMAGPRFWCGEQYRLSCYGQLLFGAARGDQTGGRNAGVHWGWVGAMGGGIEVRLTNRIVLRPVSVDLMLLGVQNNVVSSARMGTGIVFRLR